MNTTAFFKLSVIAVALLVVAVAPFTAYSGGENRAGTNAASELLIPVGARDIAMGGSSIATSSGLDAIFWNPAGLARSNRSASAMFSRMNYIADIGIDYVALAAGFEGFGTLGLSIKSVGIGDIAVTDENNPDGTGQIISPTIVNLGMTYSRLLTDRISVGATATLISERFDRVSATGFAFTAGVQYSGLANVNGLSVGVVVKNIGPQMKFDGDGLLRQGVVNDVLRPGSFYKVEAASFELPSTIEIGLAYNYVMTDENSLTLNGIFQNNNFDADAYKVGVEYNFANTLFVRGGYNFSEKTKNNAIQASGSFDKTTHIFGLTAGAGIKYPLGSLDFSFDYAFRAVQFLEDNHVFTVTLGF
jgi:opacity protein-like surface antigen